MSVYIVLTADIVKSRKLKKTQSQEDEVRDKIKALNKRLKGGLLAPFSLMRGDEIQGVLLPKTDVADAIRQMRYLLRHFKLRIGVGVGEITTGIGSSNSWEMDGPSFHLAREALELLKARERGTKPMTMVRTDSLDLDEMVNVIFLLMDSIIKRWTPEQWEAIDAYSRLGTYKAAACEIGIAFQNVQKRCYAARWGEIKAGEEYISKALQRFAHERMKTDYSPI